MQYPPVEPQPYRPHRWGDEGGKNEDGISDLRTSSACVIPDIPDVKRRVSPLGKRVAESNLAPVQRRDKQFSPRDFVHTKDCACFKCRSERMRAMFSPRNNQEKKEEGKELASAGPRNNADHVPRTKKAGKVFPQAEILLQSQGHVNISNFSSAFGGRWKRWVRQFSEQTTSKI